mmetsp:Transcript_31039/g.102669  ORF Transcript_31039/g.102669 Transcript_31039/m.102669 type:complete len:217 (-) Transcript_31039:5-655(-)
MVSSMIALTMSPSLALSAATALERLQDAWDMTSSMSLGSRPDSSRSPASSSAAAAGAAATGGAATLDASGAWNCCAAWLWACALRSSILASPKMTYVSLFGDLKTSGFEMAKRMFLDFLTVTRMTSGTPFMPSFCMALRFFFSARFCLPLAPSPASPPSAAAPSSCSSRPGISSSSSSESSSSSGSFATFSSRAAIVQTRDARRPSRSGADRRGRR